MGVEKPTDLYVHNKFSLQQNGCDQNLFVFLSWELYYIQYTVGGFQFHFWLCERQRRNSVHGGVQKDLAC